jgi:hypothetical protein
MQRTVILFIFFLALGWLLYLPVLAENDFRSPVPEEVLNKFYEIFPNAGSVEWTKKGSNFRADFLYHHLTVSITFDEAGEIRKGIHEIQFNQLPTLIIQKIRKDYCEFKGLIVLEKYNGRKLEYEVEIMKGYFHYGLRFSSKGRLVSQCEVDKRFSNEFVWN